MGTPIRHPLIDEITDRIALVESRAEVVRLSAPLAALLARPVARGRTLVLLTPDSSRLTVGLRSALVAARGVWAVVSGSGYRDGITGVDHATLEEAAAGVPADVRHAEADPLDESEGAPPVPEPGPTVVQLSVDVTLLHRADHHALLGGALEIIARAIGGRSADDVPDGGWRPLAWGASEPLEKGWDRWVLTQDARHRTPEATRVIVEGDHLSAAVIARVTDQGMEETIALTADVPGGFEGLDAAIERLRAALGDLTRTALPTFALVLAREGEVDRSFRPVIYSPPNPVVLLIGAPSVRRLALAESAFAPGQEIDVVGRPTLPAFLLPLGSAQRSGWDALHDALDSVGSERLTTLVDKPLLQAWEDDLHGDLDRHGEPHPHDDAHADDQPRDERA